MSGWLRVDGRAVALETGDEATSLLDVLRRRAGTTSVKDGCSPQGQCGCCTVLVDGAARVACVTQTRRVVGRDITTVDGLEPAVRDAWVRGFCRTGASQCGFCTPGIIVRLAATAGRVPVEDALLAHLCRCTGWRTILEAAHLVADGGATDAVAGDDRDWAGAARRAAIEGHTSQAVGPEVALGRGGFADDTAPVDALVAVPDGRGGWVVGPTVTEARAAAGRVQGRNTTLAPTWPVALPPGDWDVTLRTTWVEPAYLEPDASWCRPGGEPVSPLANGGAFGAKVASVAPATARRLADEHGCAVRVVLAREDVVRLGPKRPPLAGGVRRDGTGVLRVVRTSGIARAIAAVAPGLVVEEVDVPGPPTSAAIRGAGWAEAAVMLAAAAGRTTVTSPAGATASAYVGLDDGLRVQVACGRPLDPVVLRSYCVGAAHMALGWVRSEAIAVDDDGSPLDLTIRSFGVLRARDTPAIDVEIDDGDGRDPVNGSDAVFAAVAAAVWQADGLPDRWPDRCAGSLDGRQHPPGASGYLRSIP